MDKQKIIKLLNNCEGSEQFASYIVRLKNEKNKDGSLKNIWIQKRTEEEMVDLFNRVLEDKLIFDGKHITLQSTGISYDYVAYKNRMLVVYPESKIDVSLVYDGDKFQVAKESGKVIYSHQINNPFQREEKDIIGGYCVIINKRGEFITMLSKADIDKHRKTAKTDFIWRNWFVEMALKTIIKKAVKYHFADIFENIEENDNENYSLENPVELDLEYKKEIDEIKTIEELKEYYKNNKGKGADFDKYISIRKEQLKNEETK